MKNNKNKAQKIIPKLQQRLFLLKEFPERKKEWRRLYHFRIHGDINRMGWKQQGGSAWVLSGN